MADQQQTYALFLSDGPDGAVTVRQPSPPGGPRLDFARDVRPGDDFLGIPYADLKGMGPGRHDVPASRFEGAEDDGELVAHAQSLLDG